MGDVSEPAAVEPEAIQPDDKDWTWVLDRPCPDCGADVSRIAAPELAELLHENTRGWYDALDGTDAAVRPAPERWSPLEYACHVRDVHALFEVRVRAMLEQDDPTYVSWDQDAAAVEQRYHEQDPTTVIVELVEAAASAAAVYAGVRGADWQRTGHRGDGAQFTIESLGRYHLHDVVHHLHDLTLDAR